MAEEEGATVSVKLKVLYTFDAEHKIDHLSRPPQSYDVETAPIDDNTTIGVIDLRSCLQAVTASSPELLHFHESDYTVYAYDYSEPNTPLVGQGMLSKVMSPDDDSNEAMITGKITMSVLAKLKKNAQPFLEVKLRFTPIAPSASRARSGSMSSVTEGMQSQWSGFSQVGPAATDRPQSPADMSRLDNVHRTLHEGGLRRESSFTNNVPWGAVSRPASRPGTPNQAYPYPPPQPSSTHSRTASQWVNYVAPQQHMRRASESGYGSGDEAFDEGPAKKRARITKVQKAKKTDFNIEKQPNSLRTAAMGASSLRIHQPVPFNPTAALQRGFSTEEPVRPPTPIAKPARKSTGRPIGRPKKYQKPQNAEPSSPTRQTLPPPQIPNSNASSPEERRDSQQNRTTSRTPEHMPSSPPLLYNQNLTTSPKLPEHHSPLAQVSSNQDSGFYSAQVGSANGEDDQQKDDETPMTEMYFDNTLFDNDMSWLDDAMHANAVDMTHDLNSLDAANHYTPVFDDESCFEGPTPQAMPANGDPPPNVLTPPGEETSQQNQRNRESSVSQQPTASAPPMMQLPQQNIHPSPTPPPERQTIPIPTLHRTITNPQSQAPPTSNSSFPKPLLPTVSSSQPSINAKTSRPVPALMPRPPPPPTSYMFQRSQSVLPPIPASDPGTRPFQRSNTWGPTIMSDAIMSDAGGPEDSKGKRAKRIGKEQTKARLEAAIAAGGMPPYCHNCGAIETPAWRRGFVKQFTTPFEAVETSLNAGEMCYKQILESNPDGSVKTWRGWKVEKSGDQKDEDWEQINLCNPCGLWFHKTKTVRPPEKWQKKEKDSKEKRKRKRPPKPPKSRLQPPRAASANLRSDNLQSDAPEPPSEDSSPADTSAEDGNDEGNDENNDSITIDGDQFEDSQEPELPPMPKNMMSAQLGRRTVKWADVPARQAQSSPVGRVAVQTAVETGLTPDKPLRRKLFSPGTADDPNAYVLPPVLAERHNMSLLPSFVRRSPRLNKTRDVFAVGGIAVAVTADGSGDDGKENITPRLGIDHDDDFNDLFGDHDDLMLPPATPTPKRRSERIHLRTPGKSPSRGFGIGLSGNAQSTPNAIKTPRQTSKMEMAELFLDTITRNLGPEFMTPNSRSIWNALSSPSAKKGQNRTGFTPKAGNTPGRMSVNFDFPDLPSLKPSSPMSRDDTGHAFSELPTERLYPMDDNLNTDAPMPSSPPVGAVGAWHDRFDDIIDFGNHGFEEDTEWEKMLDPGSASKFRTPKKSSNGLLDIETPGRSGLRRSPRRSRQEE